MRYVQPIAASGDGGNQSEAAVDPAPDAYSDSRCGAVTTLGHLGANAVRTEEQQDFSFVVRAQHFLWDGDYYHASPFGFRLAALSMEEAEAWLGPRHADP